MQGFFCCHLVSAFIATIHFYIIFIFSILAAQGRYLRIFSKKLSVRKEKFSFSNEGLQKEKRGEDVGVGFKQANRDILLWDLIRYTLLSTMSGITGTPIEILRVILNGNVQVSIWPSDNRIFYRPVCKSLKDLKTGSAFLYFLH